MADEEPVLFADGGEADGVFDEIVVQASLTMAQMCGERLPVAEEIVAGFADERQAPGLDLSLRSMGAVRRRRLLRPPGRTPHGRIDEPQGQLLGQCRHGGVLKHHEKRARFLSSLRTQAEAKTVIFDHIEAFDERSRLHSALGYKSPLFIVE